MSRAAAAAQAPGASAPGAGMPPGRTPRGRADGAPPPHRRRCPARLRLGRGRGAVAPTTGERFVLDRPSLHPESGPRVVDTFAQACPDRLPRLLLDNRGLHQAQRLTLPATGRPGFLAPDGAELHPSERRWRDVKDDLAWPPGISVEAPPDSVRQRLQADDAPTRQALPGDTSLLEAINARCA
jgi:hypothetical protein